MIVLWKSNKLFDIDSYTDAVNFKSECTNETEAFLLGMLDDCVWKDFEILYTYTTMQLVSLRNKDFV